MTVDDKREALLTAIRGQRRHGKDIHMDFVELAFRVAPKEAAQIELRNLHSDEQITQMCKELCRLYA